MSESDSELTRGRLARLPVTFTAGQARRAGVAPRDLYRWRDQGVLWELSRGVFRAADAAESAHLDLLAVAARAPAGVVCLESALALHDLIDDIPSAVHLAIPRGTHPPKIVYPVVVTHQFERATFELGVAPFEATAGEYVRVYGPARSVVDVMRLRHLVGDTLALHALGRYLRRAGQAGVPDLLDLAHTLGVEGPTRSAVEAVLA
jgi:predicted transcriptional regulator of viral defense system